MKSSAITLLVAGTLALGFAPASQAQLSNNERALLVDYLKRIGAKTKRDLKCEKIPSISIPYTPSFWAANASDDAELSRGLEVAYCDLHPLRCEALEMWISAEPVAKGYIIRCR